MYMYSWYFFSKQIGVLAAAHCCPLRSLPGGHYFSQSDLECSSIIILWGSGEGCLSTTPLQPAEEIPSPVAGVLSSFLLLHLSPPSLSFPSWTSCRIDGRAAISIFLLAKVLNIWALYHPSTIFFF